MIGADDLSFFVDRALDAMVSIVVELGDEGANVRPGGRSGANSAYAILHHCLGVMDYWGGHVVGGRSVDRDRDAELRASGPVAPLLDRVEPARRRFCAVVTATEPSAAPRGRAPDHYQGTPAGATQGGAIIHVLEELFQHLGQMQAQRDEIRTQD